MQRRALNLLSVMSVIAVVSIGGIWIRSYYHGDSISFSGPGRLMALNTEKGCLWVYSLRDGDLGSDEQFHGWSLDSEPTVPWSDSMYLYIAALDDVPQVLATGSLAPAIFDASDHWALSMDGETGWFARVPLWMLMLVASVPFVVALVRWCVRTGRRLTGRLCPDCGYDLTGSGTNCPECGLLVNDRLRGVRTDSTGNVQP